MSRARPRSAPKRSGRGPMDSAAGSDVMRLSALRGMKVRSLDGETLGRVHEVHCEAGRVTALMCGPGSFIERWTARKEGRRIPWKEVRRIDRDAVVVTPDPPQKKPSAARNRRGTRRPSAPRPRR
ncbi:MAG: PRC-barrel domain-containing protein [Sphingomicrobium sp.]